MARSRTEADTSKRTRIDHTCLGSSERSPWREPGRGVPRFRARKMGEETKKRATASGVDARRKVKAALADLNADIGDWQGQAAHLSAMATRDADRMAAPLQALRAKIENGRDRLLEAVAQLPPELHSHGRVVDTRKSLEGILDRLRKLDAGSQKGSHTARKQRSPMTPAAANHCQFTFMHAPAPLAALVLFVDQIA